MIKFVNILEGATFIDGVAPTLKFYDSEEFNEYLNEDPSRSLGEWSLMDHFSITNRGKKRLSNYLAILLSYASEFEDKDLIIYYNSKDLEQLYNNSINKLYASEVSSSKLIDCLINNKVKVWRWDGSRVDLYPLEFLDRSEMFRVVVSNYSKQSMKLFNGLSKGDITDSDLELAKDLSEETGYNARDIVESFKLFIR